jgi:biotin operon repressor
MPTKPTTLTDTQLVILTAAASRESGLLLPAPPSVKARGGALSVSLQSLIDKGYAAEIEASSCEDVWREDPERGRLALVITETGLVALGVADEPDTPAGTKSQAGAPAVHDPAPLSDRVPPGSKRDRLIELLAADTGATIEILTQELGWLAHTVRAAISGLRKRGVTVETIRDGGITVYRCRPTAASTSEAGDE